MTLPSDSEYHEKNTRSTFTNKLPETIRLQKEEWEVALAEVIVTNEYKNIVAGENEFTFVTTNSNIVNELKSTAIPNEYGNSDEGFFNNNDNS